MMAEVLIEVSPPRHLAKTTLPLPRLRHCPVGTAIRLAGESRLRTILDVDDHYAYFDGGNRASLCCEVSEAGMVFGDGDGWRPRLIPTLCGKP